MHAVGCRGTISCFFSLAIVKPTSSILVRAAELKSQIIAFQASVQEEILAGRVSPWIDPSKVNIIAHSMGGLDARYLIAKLDGHSITVRSIFLRSFSLVPSNTIVLNALYAQGHLHYCKASLTTLATPHHGSPFSLAFTTRAEVLRVCLMSIVASILTLHWHSCTLR